MNATKQMEDAVFFAAVSLNDAEQRRRFLDQACAGEPDLRVEVERLFTVSAEAERFFTESETRLSEVLTLAFEPED